MTKPDAAVGTRSLEEILASIRKSLSDESVDGLVELSAAAAAAVRAESAPADADTAPASEGQQEAADALTNKLAGALNGTRPPDEDLTDLLAEPALPALEIPKDARKPDTSTAPDVSKDSLWFLRPGAPDDAQASPGADSHPVLSIDSRDEDDAAAGGSEEGPEAELKAEPRKLAVPRLDPEKISLLNKLKASSSAALEAIEKQSPVEEPPAVDLPTAFMRRTKPAAPDPSVLTRADTFRVPLFGGETDNRKPVVSIPSQPAKLVPDPVAEEAPAAAPAADVSVAPIAAEAGSADAAPDELVHAAAKTRPVIEPDVDDMLVAPTPAPAPVLDPAPVQEAAFDAAPEPASTADTAVAPPPPVPATANKPLEDMIAAVLEPVLQKLLERNLTPMLEAMVRREVVKALKDAGER